MVEIRGDQEVSPHFLRMFPLELSPNRKNFLYLCLNTLNKTVRVGQLIPYSLFFCFCSLEINEKIDWFSVLFLIELDFYSSEFSFAISCLENSNY